MGDGGKLFYIIGPSGAGKDSLMRYARHSLAAAPGVVFAHRYITRPVETEGENHIALSEDEFFHRRAQGCFALSWHCHGLYYGIGVEIDHWLSNDLHVVVNGSRAYLAEAAERYPQLRPVAIRVTPERLAERLRARGREDETQIGKRLARAGEFDHLQHPHLCTVHNDGCLEEAGEALVRVLSPVTVRVVNSTP